MHPRLRLVAVAALLALVVSLLTLSASLQQRGINPTGAGSPHEERSTPASREHAKHVDEQPLPESSRAGRTLAANTAELRAWLAQAARTSGDQRAGLLAHGTELARERRASMARLLRADPRAALAAALRWDEYAALPPSLRASIEQPFSANAEYENYPVCGAPGGDAAVTALSLPGGVREARAFGVRSGLLSKRSIPVQGIELDGAAAFHDAALVALADEELALVAHQFPAAQTDTTRDFLTGEPIRGGGVAALGGGRVHHFATLANLERLNAAIAQLEQLPGPEAGSGALTYAASPAPGAETSGFDLPTVQALEQQQASAWTEQPKRVFIIRVDFSDLQGASHTQEATAEVLSTTVSNQVRAMSYGKTWIVPSVSANTYRMPQTSAYYVNGTVGSSLNSELLRDARNTFRSARSGGDATVNIGPSSTSTNGDGGGLGDFDIVGVLFASMGMHSTLTYGGLAGGSNLWMQGNISSAVFTHEFGHNFGIGHSSFWLTNDGSVTGGGANDEYGDDFDIMGGGSVPRGHYHPQAKAKLNWLTTAEWADATALGSATHRLYRVDSQFTSGTPRGVRVTRSAVAGAQEYLWLGYRPAYQNLPALSRGAYLVWQRPAETRCWLLDTTPATSNVINDAPIALGRTFADAASGSFITPLAVGGSGDNAYIDVRVNFGPYPTNHAPALGGISGPTSVAARSLASYSAAASDSDGDTLAYAWDLADGSAPDNASAIATRWIVGGTYPLSVTASDMKGGTAQATTSITVTDPLDTWTTTNAGTSQTISRLVYGKGRYVAAAYWGDTFLSWDGVAWNYVGQPPDIDEPMLAFGGGVFVAAGIRESAPINGQLCWSPDGRRWRTATFPQGLPPLRGVTYGNGRFVAVGDDGLVMTSTDGVTWTSALIAAAPDLRLITWSGTNWIAVAMHPTAARPEVIWTSPNATTWSQGPALGVDTFSLTTAGATTYALGWYAGVLYSTDGGATWLDAALPEGSRWTTYALAAASNGTLLCFGSAMDESGSPYAQLVSIDGRRWVRSAGGSVTGGSDCLVFGNGRFVAGDGNGTVRLSNPLFPTNTTPSVSFTTAPATPPVRQPVLFAASGTDADGDTLTYAWDFGADMDAVDGNEIAPTFNFGGTYTATLRVVDGRGGLLTLTQPLTISDPARRFTDRSITSTLGDLQAIAVGGGRAVAVGSRFNNTFAGPAATSTDGLTWTVSTVGANKHLYDLAYDGTQFIGAGTRYDFTTPAGYRGWIAVSTNGTTWSERYFGGNWLEAIAYGGGVYLAVGDAGTVLRSTDGLAWSPSAPPGLGSTLTLRGVTWNGAVFLLTGYTGNNGTTRVFTSPDGLSWTEVSAGAGVASWQDLRRSAWLNGRFLASGWYSRLRTSLDGGSTFTTTRSDYEETPGLAYAAGLYLAAGVNRSASDADVHLLSLDGLTWVSAAAPTTANCRDAVAFNDRFITVGDAGSLWVSDPLTPATGYATWQASRFPLGGLPSLGDRDPDGDGLTNLLEYALDLAPFSPAAAPLRPTISGARGALSIVLPEPARSDVVYRVQGRSNLATGAWTDLASKSGTAAWTWLAAGVSQLTTSANPGGGTAVTVGTPDADASQPAYFLRLVVEAQ